MKLDTKNFRLLLIGSLGLSVLVFFVISYFGLSLLSVQSEKMVDLKLKSETADLQLSNLEQAKKDVDKYSYFKEVAKTVIPNDKNQAQSILDIFQIADQAGISLRTITFPSSNLGATTVVTPGQDVNAKSTSKGAVSQAIPVTGISGLYSLELKITPGADANVPPDQQITYDKMIDFLRRLESNRRTAQFTQISIEPAPAGQALKFNLTLNTFIKP